MFTIFTILDECVTVLKFAKEHQMHSKAEAYGEVFHFASMLVVVVVVVEIFQSGPRRWTNRLTGQHYHPYCQAASVAKCAIFLSLTGEMS